MLHEIPENGFGLFPVTPPGTPLPTPAEGAGLLVIEAALAYQNMFRPRVSQGTRDEARRKLFERVAAYRRVIE
jgi:hypothetical protein